MNVPAARRDAAPDRPPLPAAVAGGLAAGGVAWAAMAGLRATLQVRTLPERMTEWLLLFVPLDLFEAGLRRFGFEAKGYALGGAELVQLALLAVLGAAVLRRRWPARALAVLALGLWLLTMLGVMPLTGAGIFASGLIRGTGAAVVGYLAVALAYASALAVAAAPVRGRAAPAASSAGRPALLLAAAAAAAFARSPSVAGWSPQPALPAAVVPFTVAAPAGALAIAPPAADVRPDEPPPAPSGAPGPAEPWNTSDLDTAANGNLALAAALVFASGVPAATTPLAGRAPWQLVGEVHEFAGTVERSLGAGGGREPPRWEDAGWPTGEVVLTGAAEASMMPLVCVAVAGWEELQVGDRARVRGYVVGLSNTDVRDGGSTTGLVLVGEIIRLPG